MKLYRRNTIDNFTMDLYNDKMKWQRDLKLPEIARFMLFHQKHWIYLLFTQSLVILR